MAKAAAAPGALALFDPCSTHGCPNLATEGEWCDSCGAKRSVRPRCLFRSSARGAAARVAEFEQWRTEFGNWGCLVRAHGWMIATTSPADPADRCQPTLLRVDVRDPGWVKDRSELPDCTCCTDVNDYLYRGACLRCDWESAPHPFDGENAAVEEAMDHAWPGWRTMPIVPRYPFDDKRAQERWLDTVVHQYPAGWLESGGPFRTLREPLGTRHHVAEPFGGYDMGVLAGTEAVS